MLGGKTGTSVLEIWSHFPLQILSFNYSVGALAVCLVECWMFYKLFLIQSPF